MSKPTPTRKRRERKYPAEYRERAVETCLRAIKMGWPVAKFARMARIPRITVLDWLAEDGNFERYKQAMETKALEIPSLHMQVIRRVINGTLDPKAGRAAMQGLEFRMMREIKKIYEQTSTKKHEHNHRFEDMSDDEIARRKAEIIAKATGESTDDTVH